MNAAYIIILQSHFFYMLLNVQVPVAQSSSITLKIQQAKNFAVAQAQQEGCTGNYRVFDSPFGNFLVPVIPTRAELDG